MYLQHIKKIICRDDEAKYNYVLGWMAYIMQNPLSKTGVALVITSEEHGTGKNVFADTLRKLNGPYGKTINDLKSIAGEFNATLVGAHLIVANELTNFDYDSRR